MEEKKENSNYDKNQIKEMFKSYRDRGDMYITDKEYDLFCLNLCYLPKEIIDKIVEEVSFIVLSAERNGKEYPACYTNLKSKDLENKIGIIFITPLFFKPKSEPVGNCYCVFHEIAHHILGHKDFNNLEEREKAESEAHELANKWIRKAFSLPME